LNHRRLITNYVNSRRTISFNQFIKTNIQVFIFGYVYREISILNKLGTCVLISSCKQRIIFGKYLS